MAGGTGRQVTFPSGGGPGWTYWELLDQLADAVGLGSSTRGRELDRLIKCIETGHRRMMTPPILPEDINAAAVRGRPVPMPHTWSWLKPIASLAITSSADIYDLPNDFGSLVGGFIFSGGEAAPIEIIDYGTLMRLRATTSVSYGDPQKACVYPAPFSPEEGQGYKVAFWPYPNASRTLSYRYNVIYAPPGEVLCQGTGTMAQVGGTGEYVVLTDAGGDFLNDDIEADDRVLISDTNTTFDGIQLVSSVSDAMHVVLTEGADTAAAVTYKIMPSIIYLIGGQPCNELLLQFCLDTWERRVEKKKDVQSDLLMEMLRAAVLDDRKRTAADYIGKWAGTESDTEGFEVIHGDSSYGTGA